MRALDSSCFFLKSEIPPVDAMAASWLLGLGWGACGGMMWNVGWGVGWGQ
jgi:hypothetical protein